MFKTERMQAILAKLVEEGITLEVYKDCVTGRIIVDTNLMAKSHLHLYEEDDEVYYAMRYGRGGVVDEITELLYLAKEGMHGQNYMNSFWYELLTREGVLDAQ